MTHSCRGNEQEALLLVFRQSRTHSSKENVTILKFNALNDRNL